MIKSIGSSFLFGCHHEQLILHSLNHFKKEARQSQNIHNIFIKRIQVQVMKFQSITSERLRNISFPILEKIQTRMQSGICHLNHQSIIV